MYRLSREQEQIQQLVFQNTPIDTIMTTYDLPNGIEVTGHAGCDIVTYRIYENGTIVER